MSTGVDGVTSAYRPLHDHLAVAPGVDELVLTLAEVESILGRPLPRNAHEDPFWWRSTPRKSWARSWLRADRTATLSLEEGTVSFAAGFQDLPLDLEKTIAQRRRDEGNALVSLSYGPVETELRDRWWEPHHVYVRHIRSEGLYKVGVTRHDARRLSELTARGRADVATICTLANRHAARLVEIRVLDETDAARRVADRFNSHNGETEHWDDSMPPPALEPIAEALARDESLQYWLVSKSERGEDFERN